MPTEEDWQKFIQDGENGDDGNQDGDDFGEFDGNDTGTEYVNQDVHEIYSTISENFELHNGTASVQVRCEWNKRYDVVAGFLEGGEQEEPKIYQPWDDFNLEGTNMVATSVRIEPMPTKYKSTGQSIEYKYALITLNYSMMATEVKVESTNQYMTIAPNNLFWNVNGEMIALAPEEAPGVRLASYDLTLSHPHIQSRTKDGTPLQAFEGYVNDRDIEVYYNGVELKFKRQTLLCTAPSINAGANLFGLGFNNISVRLSYNPLGHNEFFNPLQGKDKALHDITAHKVQMFKKISDGNNTKSDNKNNAEGTDGAGDSDSKDKEDQPIVGNYQRVAIYPERDFIPLFELFKIFVYGGSGSGSSDPNYSPGNTGSPEFDPNDSDPDNPEDGAGG